MEINQVKVLVDKRAKENNVDVQKIWDAFFFEKFLYRVSQSKFKDRFVFKGGFLLEVMLGIASRSTTDIDFKLVSSNDDFDLHGMIQDIINSVKDNIEYKIIEISDIKAETKYGGKTVKLEAKFHNIKKNFGIDIWFKNSDYAYHYNYISAGEYYVEKMKELAINGISLNTYINLHVKKLFFSKTKI